MGSSRIKLKTFPAVTVATPGVRKALFTDQLLVYAVTVMPLSTNTGTQYVGDETVSSTNGAPILPGDACEVEPPDRAVGTDQFYINELYVDSTTANAEFRIVAWVRE